jgi:hypothetical protein
MSKIKYACSLGFNCHAAQFLKDNKLKMASYPFDWIMSDLSGVKHSIEDNFSDYLNKELYIDFNRSDRCGHKTLCSNMFVHHNPLSNEKDYQYFTRCVGRFQDLLKNKECKLFIISIINGEHNIGDKLSDEIKSRYIEFNDFLKKYTKKFKLLIIINYPNKKNNKHKLTQNDNLMFLEIDTLSCNTGTHYENDIDNKYLYNTVSKLFKFKLVPV